MKFDTKPMVQYLPHLRQVATLPWEINDSNFLQIFSRYGRNANKLHFNNVQLCYSPRNYDIFGVHVVYDIPVRSKPDTNVCVCMNVKSNRADKTSEAYPCITTAADL